MDIQSCGTHALDVRRATIKRFSIDIANHYIRPKHI